MLTLSIAAAAVLLSGHGVQGGILATSENLGATTIGMRAGIHIYDGANHDAKLPNVRRDPVSRVMATLAPFRSSGSTWVRMAYAFDFSGSSPALEDAEEQRELVWLPRFQRFRTQNPGTRLILVLTTDHRHHTDGRWRYGSPVTPEWKDAWLRWAKDAIRLAIREMGRDRVVFQLGNELNANRFYPGLADHYADIVRRLVRGLNAEGLRPLILPSGVKLTEGATLEQWNRFLHSRGLSPLLDGIAVHAYTARGAPFFVPETTLRDLAIAREFARRARFRTPDLYITESGCHRFGINPATQASVVIRSQLVAGIAQARVAVVYEAKDRRGWCGGSGNDTCMELEQQIDPNTGQKVHPSEALFGMMDQAHRLNLAGLRFTDFLRRYASYRIEPASYRSPSPNRHRVDLFSPQGRRVRAFWASNASAANAEYPLQPVFR